MTALVRRSPYADVPTPPAYRGFRNEITESVDLAKAIERVYGGGESSTGINVGADSAMQCAAVYACVRVLAESVAQLPCHVYERTEAGGKKRRDDHTLSWLLNVQPNPWQTAFEFREMLMGHLALRGNAYAYKNRLMSGRLWELIPLHPARMSLKQNADHTLSYEYTGPNGKQVPLNQSQVLHLRGLSSNGIEGISPIAMAREAVGLALATERHGGTLFKNAATPSGAVKHPRVLNDKSYNRLKDDFRAKFQGVDNAGEVLLLEEGMEFVKIGMTSDEAQFLETRKYQRSEIASIFRIPPHMIGDLERATFSNIEHQGLEFVMHSLLPWLRRWEQAITRDLFSATEQGQVFAEFKVDSLLRGDIKTRYEAYGKGITDGWLRRNEVRVMENLDPADGLDDFLTPMNMASGTTPDKPEQP